MMMEPGRGLDAEIAEKVMEWTTYEEYVHGPLMHGSGMMTLYRGEGAKWNGRTWSVDGFKPSTDIAAAWPVLEKMRARLPGQEVMLYWCHGWSVGSLCQAPSTIEIGDSYGDDRVMAAPHAICLAALEVFRCRASDLS